MTEKPQLDYRIEKWPKALQVKFWLGVYICFLPRLLQAISHGKADSFLQNREYLEQAYDRITANTQLTGQYRPSA